MKLKINKKNKAFTLSEVIVVTLIIVLIYTIVSVSLREVRRNSRDAKRVVDMKELQIILEEYYRNEGSYPAEIIFGESLIGERTNKLYKANISKNPLPPSEECLTKEYYYERRDENDSYILKTCLEKNSDKLSSGINCFSPTGSNNSCYDNNVCLDDQSSCAWISDGQNSLLDLIVGYRVIEIINGIPYILYMNQSDSTLEVLFYENKSWNYFKKEELALYGCVANFDDSFDLNYFGTTPYIFFSDCFDNKPSVIKFNGTSWESVGPLNIIDNFIGEKKITFDNNGNPYTVFMDGGTPQYSISVMKFNGSNWDYIGSKGITSDMASSPSIELHNDDVYICFQDYTQMAFPTVMKYNGVSWVHVGQADLASTLIPGETGAQYIKMTILNGEPYVAYYSVLENRIVVAKFDGNNWVFVGDQTIFEPGYSPSLIIESFDNKIFLAYKKGYGNDEIVAKVFKDGTWRNMSSLGTAPTGDYYFSFDVHDNTPYLIIDTSSNERSLIRFVPEG